MLIPLNCLDTCLPVVPSITVERRTVVIYIRNFEFSAEPFNFSLECMFSK